jgi:hypothetical protein
MEAASKQTNSKPILKKSSSKGVDPEIITQLQRIPPV